MLQFLFLLYAKSLFGTETRTFIYTGMFAKRYDTSYQVLKIHLRQITTLMYLLTQAR